MKTGRKTAPESEIGVEIIISLTLTFINIDIKSSNTHQALLVVTN